MKAAFILPAFIFLNCQSDIEKANEVLNEKLNDSEKILNEAEDTQLDSTNFDWDKIQEFTMPSSPDTLMHDIVLSERISFSWDNRTHNILHDAKWSHLKRDFISYHNQLIELITDTTRTKAYGCPDLKSLTKGQLAFILLDEFNHLPYFKLFGMQFDAQIEGCDYPVGLLEYVHRESKSVQVVLEDYLKTE